jgi:hypothetical protein
MPQHTHDTPYGMLTGNYQGPQQNENAQGYDGGGNFHLGISALARTTTSAGSSDPLSITTQNIQPFIVLNYIIKAEGSTIVEQNVKPSDGILINDEAALTNLLAAGITNTIKMDVDSNDFEFNGNTLKLKDDSTSVATQIETKVKTISIETVFGSADISHSIDHNLGGIPAFFNMYVKFKTSNNTLGWSQGDMVPLFNGEVWSGEGRIFSSGMSSTKIYWAYGGSTYNNIRISKPTGHGVLTPNATDHALVINATRYI